MIIEKLKMIARDTIPDISKAIHQVALDTLFGRTYEDDHPLKRENRLLLIYRELDRKTITLKKNEI